MPATKPYIAEYGDLTSADMATRTVIERGYIHGGSFQSAELVLSSAGYECAGSAARWTDGYWSVETYFNGARHGRRFKTEADALALFDAWMKGLVA